MRIEIENMRAANKRLRADKKKKKRPVPDPEALTAAETQNAALRRELADTQARNADMMQSLERVETQNAIRY